MSAPIAICLPTYNGALFLSEQLRTIEEQHHTDWHLYARDDGSDDATPEILAAFATSHPDRVTIVTDTLGHLGPRGNFNRLMVLTREPYIAFSDQDDLWRRGKLGRALARLQALENGDAPAMVHADRTLIDADGRLIANSYWETRDLLPSDISGPEGHYAFCLAAGSTMLVNRALLDRALPVPEAARMHDCWLELVAHAFGRVDWLDEVALDHRRHGDNVSGGAPSLDTPDARRLGARVRRLFRSLPVHRATWAVYFAQARAFQARYGNDLTPDAAARLAAFCALPEKSVFGRVLALHRARAAPPGPGRAAALALLAGRERHAMPPASVRPASSAA